MTIEEEINAVLSFWDAKQLMSFLDHVIPILELYDVDEVSDWVRELVGIENQKNVRLIRTVYLLSRLSEEHAHNLYKLKTQFKNLWRKMEKIREFHEKEDKDD